MTPDLRFSTLRPADLMAIERQASQRRLFGLPAEMDADLAEQSAAQPIAWCAREGSRILACFGILETFPGRQGTAWALLAEGIGNAHLQLTRFIQGQIAGCGLARLELVARAADIEDEIAQAEAADFGGFNQAGLIRRAMRRATPEMRWAVLLGMQPAYLLRQYGAEGETYMLFERIAPRMTVLEEAA